jgi:hypothetical protein
MPDFEFPDFTTVTDLASLQQWEFDFAVERERGLNELLDMLLKRVKEYNMAADQHRAAAIRHAHRPPTVLQ